MMTVVPNEWMKSLPSYEPGRPLEEVARELGLDGIDDMIKLASNENALGPSPLAMEAMCREASRMHLYPDGGAFYLRQVLAEKFNVDPSWILIGNGSNELIELLGHVYLGPDTDIVMSQYAFVVYTLVARLFGARTQVAPARDLGHDLDALRDAITPATKLVFIANPNNPTGTEVVADALDRFLDEVPDHVLVVLDEAYVDLLPPEEQCKGVEMVRTGRNVCVLRTFSKAYGLAGLRVGYAVASPACIALLNRARQPFNVNSMGQVAALAALEDEAHLDASRELVREGVAQLAKGLDALQIPHVPSRVNFLLVKTGRGREVFQALQREHVIVRPMDVGYGLPEYIRATVGTAEENDRFLSALERVTANER